MTFGKAIIAEDTFKTSWVSNWFIDDMSHNLTDDWKRSSDAFVVALMEIFSCSTISTVINKVDGFLKRLFFQALQILDGLIKCFPFWKALFMKVTFRPIDIKSIKSKNWKIYISVGVSNPLTRLLLVTISDFADLKGHIIAKKNHRSPECIWMVSPSKLHPKFLFYWGGGEGGKVELAAAQVRVTASFDP